MFCPVFHWNFKFYWKYWYRFYSSRVAAVWWNSDFESRKIEAYNKAQDLALCLFFILGYSNVNILVFANAIWEKNKGVLLYFGMFSYTTFILILEARIRVLAYKICIYDLKARGLGVHLHHIYLIFYDCVLYVKIMSQLNLQVMMKPILSH